MFFAIVIAGFWLLIYGLVTSKSRFTSRAQFTRSKTADDRVFGAIIATAAVAGMLAFAFIGRG